MHEITDFLANIGRTDAIDVAKGAAAIVIAALFGFVATRLYVWATRTRRRDQIDAIKDVIAQTITTKLDNVEHGQVVLVDKVDEMSRQNASAHDQMRDRMNELARDHAETQQRVAVIEATMKEIGHS